MATVLALEGYDMYPTGGFNYRWNIVRGGGVSGGLTSVAGRLGGLAYQATPTTNAATSYLWKQFTWSQTSLTIGFALQATGALSSGQLFLGLYQAGTINPVLSLEQSTIGNINLYRNTTLIASSTGGSLLPYATWHYIEMEVVVHATAGRVSVYLDGNPTPIINFTGNTVGAASAIDSILHGVFSGSPATVNGNGVVFDDMYVIDSATRLGERRVETLRAASDSAVTWTPNSGANNFSRVNETQFDGDTTYNQTSGVNNQDFYGIGSLSSNALTVDCVNVVMFGEKTDAGTRTVGMGVKSASVIDLGTAVGLTASYVRYDRPLTLDPNGSVSWTFGSVNGLLIGPKLVS